MAFSYNLQGLATISQQEKETLSPTTTKKKWNSANKRLRIGSFCG